MKKLIVAGAAVVALIFATGCSKSGNSSASSEDKAFTDSLSQSIGTLAGSQLLNEYNNIPPEMKGMWDKAELLRGIKTMIMTDTAKNSYVVGLSIGMKMWQQIVEMEKNGVAVDCRALYAAYAKAFQADSVGDLATIARENQGLMRRAHEIMQAEQERKAQLERQAKLEKPEVKKNIAEGTAYLEKVGKEEGVKTTPSGLKYKVISEGQGDVLGLRDRVVVNYTGTLPDGTVFDASEKHGGPATLTPAGVVPGFGEGLMMMRKGAHYVLYIPAELAYDLDGTPDGSIGPMQPLTFDVEVVDVNPAPAGGQPVAVGRPVAVN